MGAGVHTRFSENISNILMYSITMIYLRIMSMAGFWGKTLGIQRVFYAYAHYYYYCTRDVIKWNLWISMHTHFTHPWVELSPVSVLDSGEINVTRFLTTL